MSTTQMETPHLLTSQEAAELAGITIRRLDHWARVGEVITPENQVRGGSGRYRFWTEAEARIIEILGRLSDQGAEMKVLRNMVQPLRDADIKPGDSRWLVATVDDCEVVALKDLPASAARGTWFVPLSKPTPSTLF